MVGFEKSHNKLNCIVIFEDIPISRQKQNFYAYRENEKMSEKLTDKFNAGLSGYVPAAPGWYLREQNNAGKNVYYPVMAWRECAGTGLLSDGVLLPVLACGITGKTSTEISGDVMFVFNEWLTPNGDGTFRDRNY